MTTTLEIHGEPTDQDFFEEKDFRVMATQAWQDQVVAARYPGSDLPVRVTIMHGTKLTVAEHPCPRSDLFEIVLSNNATRRDNWMPLTPWIIAHRAFHAVQAERSSSIRGPRNRHILQPVDDWIRAVVAERDLPFQDLDTPLWTIDTDFIAPDRGAVWAGNSFQNQETWARNLASGMTSRAARSGRLTVPFEVVPELFAEYLVTGRIRFNAVTPAFSEAWADRITLAFRELILSRPGQPLSF